jgi:hypothetical protein
MAHDVRTALTIKLFGRPITELTRSVASDAVLSALTGGSTVVDVGGCVYHRGMSSSWAIKAPVSSEIESLLSLCYEKHGRGCWVMYVPDRRSAAVGSSAVLAMETPSTPLNLLLPTLTTAASQLGCCPPAAQR